MHERGTPVPVTDTVTSGVDATTFFSVGLCMPLYLHWHLTHKKPTPPRTL